MVIILNLSKGYLTKIISFIKHIDKRKEPMFGDTDS